VEHVHYCSSTIFSGVLLATVVNLEPTPHGSWFGSSKGLQPTPLVLIFDQPWRVSCGLPMVYTGVVRPGAGGAEGGSKETPAL